MTDFSSGWSTLISAKKTSQGVIVCLTVRCRSCETRMDFYLLGPEVWWDPGAARPGWRRSAGCSERWTSSVCRNQSGLAWKDQKHWEFRILSLQSRAFFYASELKLVPVFVNEGIERHSITPAGGEVVDVDVRIAVKHKRERSDIRNTNALKSFTWTFTHPAVFIWHHSSRASLAERFSLLSSVSTLMSWICYTNDNKTKWLLCAFI